MVELSSRYTPKDVEERLYQQWESQALFHAEPDRRAPYTIVIPPPNVTGILHMGHALNNTIQDICIRFRRMQGANALWVPGTDHAGIATQNVVEKQLAKEGLRRQDLGREQFLQRVWQWKEQYGNTIIRQLKRLGSSCDWQRTRFTMDEGLSEAVAEVFIRLYEKGLIYRGNYIINWCPRCQTALSDEEAPRKETRGKLYYLKYPLVQGSGFKVQGGPRTSNLEPRTHVVVATTRPETMLGDTAVAVHPKDKRYKSLIGKTAILPLVGRELKIIADEAVDPEFGTGAVKVTPAHDPVDFQLGKTHKLEFINVMTDDGRMTNVPKEYEGLDRFECRKRLLATLEGQGMLEKTADHLHAVGHCYRCDTVIEPRLSLQWFVKMKPLAQPAIEAVKKKRITFTPARWTKVYLNWMEHIQDWCISRQIWWGHRIPVYYCQRCPADRVIVSKTPPGKCPKCGSTNLKQDEDVLDTWFSSWLWPFSTLGWPKKSKDLDYFYPTDTLVTAPEIIFFWVARMIMAGLFCMEDVPFRQVYIHGTVRDLTGKKMSKSLGNIIDPLDIIGQFGADALRYTLVTSTAVGTDVFISEEKFVVGRNFANKLWNVTRYVLSTVQGSRFKVQGHPSPFNLEPRTLSVADRWILSRLSHAIAEVTKALDRYAFNEAAQTAYELIWRDFCDWYVEVSKVRSQKSEVQLAVLAHVLETALRLLHPVMPFVTEELWQHVKPAGSPASIMTAPWPKAEKRWLDAEAEEQFALFKAVVTAIRNTKAELNVPLETKPPVQLSTKREAVRRFFEDQRPFLQVLAQVGDVTVGEGLMKPRDASATVVDGIEVIVPLSGLIDAAKERRRIQARVQELTEELGRLDVRLKDRQFTQRAPEDVVNQAKQRREQVTETLQKFTGHLQLLESL
ncbi:MAG: valine--tRNA ligase [Candidatus Omnitrophica bacterium]|nr:valine--tRNA ligase [Candidatus Omnitrophota bacterium]